MLYEVITDALGDRLGVRRARVLQGTLDELPALLVRGGEARVGSGVPGEEGFVLEDLGSVNGTFVNGRRVLGRMPLRGGERIRNNFV